ncbi:MAG: YraN family protein [Myxococcota bacterium]
MPSSTQTRGSRYEDAAENELLRRGYHVLERNRRTRTGEIDRIALEGDTLVFVEVRSLTKDAHGRPGETVGAKKQRKLIRAAQEVLAAVPEYRGRACRFDVVEVLVGPEEGALEIVIIPGAFDATSRGRALSIA